MDALDRLQLALPSHPPGHTRWSGVSNLQGDPVLALETTEHRARLVVACMTQPHPRREAIQLSIRKPPGPRTCRVSRYEVHSSGSGLFQILNARISPGLRQQACVDCWTLWEEGLAPFAAHAAKAEASQAPSPLERASFNTFTRRLRQVFGGEARGKPPVTLAVMASDHDTEQVLYERVGLFKPYRGDPRTPGGPDGVRSSLRDALRQARTAEG